MTTKPRKAPKRKAAPKKPAKTLRAKADPPNPEDRRQPMVLPLARTAGVRVTEDTALTIAAVWACVRVISETLAGIPWWVHRKRRNGGADFVFDHPVNWLLDTQASEEHPAFQWRETMVQHALTWGNAFAEIERATYSGEPVWMHLITPDRVNVERFRGRVIYDINNFRSPNTVLEAEDMFHLRGMGFDGLVGYPVIRMAARSLGIALATENDAGTLFANGSRPEGVLTHPNALSQGAKDNLEKSVNAQKKRGAMLILEEAIKYEQLGLSPRDTQLIEQRQFTPQEICRWFRVPPHKIQDLSHATFSNIEEQNLEFVDDTLRPWAERLETEADIKLFGRNNRGTLITIMDLKALKRGNMAARTAYYTAMFDRGIMSINDIRKAEDENPIGPDGDKRFVPLNMVTLDRAGEDEPESDDEPEAEAPTMDEPDDLRDKRVEAAAVAILCEACQRILNREEGQRNKTGTLSEDWLAKHRAFCVESLTKAASVLAALHSAPEESVAVAVSLFIDKHFETLGGEPLDKANDLTRLLTAAAAAKGGQ